jgi:hypothetical protein
MQLLIVFIPYLFIYSLLDMFRAASAHHQEFFSLLYMQPPVICASARPWHCLVAKHFIELYKDARNQKHQITTVYQLRHIEIVIETGSRSFFGTHFS